MRKGEVQAGWGNQRQINLLEDIGVSGKILLK
jgi:hypothetical protein